MVSNFIVQALKGDPITIYGDGKQTRSFCYVDDLVDGLLRLMKSDADITGPINLGNPDEFTMLDLANQIIAITRSKSELVVQELPTDDPKQRRPDISKARAALDWEPKVNLQDGLAQTVEFFRHRLRELGQI